MMVALRIPNEYPIVIGLQRPDGGPMTRITTDLSASWNRNELVIIALPDDLLVLLDDLRDTVRREAATPEGDAA